MTVTELQGSCVEMEKVPGRQPLLQLCTKTGLYGRVDQWKLLLSERQIKRLHRVTHSLGVLKVCFWKPYPTFHVVWNFLHLHTGSLELRVIFGFLVTSLSKALLPGYSVFWTVSCRKSPGWPKHLPYHNYGDYWALRKNKCSRFFF